MSWQTLQRAKKYSLRRFKHFHSFNPSSPETARCIYNDNWWTEHDADIPGLLGHYRKTGNSHSDPNKKYWRKPLKMEVGSRLDLKEWELEEKQVDKIFIWDWLDIYDDYLDSDW